MGFAIGYLPFALYYDEHKAFFKSTVMVEEYFWPELFTDNHTGQVMIAFLIALILLFRYLVKKGAKDTSTSSACIINKNTEELQFEIDRIKL